MIDKRGSRKSGVLSQMCSVVVLDAINEGGEKNAESNQLKANGGPKYSGQNEICLSARQILS